jgi:hypothetical protein
MADSESLGVPTNTGSTAPNAEQKENPNESPLGVYAPFPYSPEPFVELSEEARGALKTLDSIATRTDTAARRMELEQAWEALHFERGYQHLLRRKGGGWELPGSTTGYGAKSQQNNNNIYDTNVYGAKGDIIVAALSREVPKIEFFASNPEYGPDIVAAEEADNFKEIWARNNNLHSLLVDCARIFWNEDRVLLWTRYELNAQEYGFEEEPEAPTVPEDILEPPSADPTGQEAEDDVLDAETTPPEEGESEAEGVEDIIGNAGENLNRKPLGREVTTAYGKLDHKVPISVDNMKDMPWAQIAVDVDVTIGKAMFPWIADKVKVGTDGIADTQLDRIARQNVRQAVLGAYVTGDSLSRQTTIKFTWFRPSMFLDEQVSDAAKAELLEAFPNGCLMAMAGSEFAFARNESMDDHLAIGHPSSGKGQNRRSMGASLISIQKRINDWVDLLDDFFKRTVPKKWYNAEAFDMEAMKNNPNMPGSSGPYQPQPGLATADQYIMVEPTPQPQAALPDFIKWFITSLSEEISGALPSLFGAATGEETATNALLQNSSALQRVGCPWNNIQDLFAVAAHQAVKCAAECRDGKKITQNIPGRGVVSVNSANLLRGNVLCYAESNPAFPESWQQREAKLMSMIDSSAQNPALAQWLMSPENLPALADGIRMKRFKVPGASSITKQKAEFEILLRGAPQDNPQTLNATAALEKAKEGMMQAQQSGQEVPPQASAMVQQLEQAVKTLPQKISSLPVAQDESELHVVEAAQCFEWMNSNEGQKFRFGSPKQKAAYENVHLHWQEHIAMAKKIAAANAPPPPQKPPSESISIPVDKLPPEISVQALAKAGINATPEMFAQHAAAQLNEKVSAKAIPHALETQ